MDPVISSQNSSGQPGMTPAVLNTCALTVQAISLDGNGVPGVTVSLSGPAGEVLTGATDLRGAAVFPRVGCQCFTLTFTAPPGLHPFPALRTVDLSDGADHVEPVILRPGTTLTIHAFAASDRSPIGKIRYRLMGGDGSGQWDLETGPDGKASLEDLLPGQYTLSEIDVPEPYYSPQPLPSLSLCAAGNTLELQYYRYAELEVKVSAYDGKPLEGAKLQLRAEADGTLIDPRPPEPGEEPSQIHFIRLKFGGYRFVEKAVPKGYSSIMRFPLIRVLDGDKLTVPVVHYVHAYDHMMKHLLSNPPILAIILKAVTYEFSQMTVPDIIAHSLIDTEFTAAISETSVIRGLRTEILAGNGFVVFDNLFKAVWPKAFSGLTEDRLIFVGLDGQTESVNLDYTLDQRTTVYGADAMSVQHGIEGGFSHSKYGDAKHVYTVFIDCNPPEEHQNSVRFLNQTATDYNAAKGTYSVLPQSTPQNLLDPARRGMEYKNDLMHAVIIHLGPYDQEKLKYVPTWDKVQEKPEDFSNFMLKLLDLIAYHHKGVDQKTLAQELHSVLQELKKDQINIQDEFREEVKNVWNMQEGLIAMGRAEAEQPLKVLGMSCGGYTEEQISQECGISVDKVKTILDTYRISPAAAG